MKVLYAARYARFELLRAIGFLACHVAKWDVQCDRRLHRLMSYIEHTLDHRLCGWSDGDVSNINLHLYSDADFGGCNDTNKSTTGVYIAAEGRHTKWPISGLSKKQTCVSHSTPEAELVAGAFALRQEGVPVQVFFDATIGAVGAGGAADGGATRARKTLYFHADNSAMIVCCKSGKNQTMRHMGRTHGISLQWVHDELQKGYCELRYIDTSKMAADIFTKFFPQSKAAVWKEVRKLVNVLSPDEFKEMVGCPGAGFESVLSDTTRGVIAKSTVVDGADSHGFRRRRSARIRRKVADTIAGGLRRGTFSKGWFSMHEVFSEVGQAISSAVASGGSSSSWDFRSFQGSFKVPVDKTDQNYALVTTKLNQVHLVRCHGGGNQVVSEYDVAPRSFHRLKPGDVVSCRNGSESFVILRSHDPSDGFDNCQKGGGRKGGGSGARPSAEPQVASLMWLTQVPDQPLDSCQPAFGVAENENVRFIPTPIDTMPRIRGVTSQDEQYRTHHSSSVATMVHSRVAQPVRSLTTEGASLRGIAAMARRVALPTSGVDFRGVPVRSAAGGATGRTPLGPPAPLYLSALEDAVRRDIVRVLELRGSGSGLAPG